MYGLKQCLSLRNFAYGWFQIDCGLQCSNDKDCLSFRYENTICHHGGIQQPPNENDIETEICMHETKTMRKLSIISTDRPFQALLYYFVFKILQPSLKLACTFKNVALHSTKPFLLAHKVDTWVCVKLAFWTLLLKHRMIFVW